MNPQPRDSDRPLPRVPPKHDPAVRRIVEHWRRLLGPQDPDGARTLIACSGGADSSALVLALRAATSDLVIAHVVHDQRPLDEALADRDAVAVLADALGLPFVEGRARAADWPGNIEASYRRARYAELHRLALAAGCGFVATGHHAMDQAESVLMALIRGSGPAGLSGIAPRRWLRSPDPHAGASVLLVRPMLATEPSDARRLCQESGWAWQEDRTNADVSRLRARLRTHVLPPLLAARPGALRKIGDAATLQRRVAAAIMVDARALWRKRETRLDAGGSLGAIAWRRDDLLSAGSPAAAVCLRRAFALLRSPQGMQRRALAEPAGLDRLGLRHLSAVLERIEDRHAPPNLASWSGVGLWRLGDTIELRRPTRGED